MKFLISFATRFIPRHYLQKVSHLFLLFISPFYAGNTYEDPIDGKTYRKLLPYGRIHPRKNALAPFSMSLERHRLIWLYLKDKTNFFTDNIKFLHIAPEYCFKNRFKKMENIKYITGDLISPWADVKMDVEDIPFEENTFDAIMCNHVLEHVNHDKKAMQEFYRVLKPGGWGIFMVPIDYANESTMEDPNIITAKDREKYYWQSDHMRLYGRDYGKKLAAVGFIVTEDDFMATLSDELRRRYVLPETELVYYCQKPVTV